LSTFGSRKIGSWPSPAGCSQHFVARPFPSTWKIFSVTIGPFEIDVLESFVFVSGAHIFLHCSEWATYGAIDAMTRDNDASFESETFAQRPLPKANFVGVANRGKRIEKNDFGGIDSGNVSELETLIGVY